MYHKHILSPFMIFLPFMALAEYNGHQIEFTIELMDGNQIHGYNFLAEVFPKDDSISYKEFLETNYELVVGNQFNDGVGEMAYFQNRIRYDYTDSSGHTGFIFTLTDKKSVDKDKVKGLKIIGLTEQSYAIGVSSTHEYEDRLWMATWPEEQFSFGGMFCSNEIFIHEKSPGTASIISELEKFVADFGKEVNVLEQEMKHADGEDYYRFESRIMELEEEIDGHINEIMRKFEGMKVVVISMCSC